MAVQEFGQYEVVARASVNQRINQINNYFPVSIANGGTGANTPSSARYALGIEGRTTLYSNASGTSSTITLSDNLSNYLYIDITYMSKNTDGYLRHATKRVYLINRDTTQSIYADLIAINPTTNSTDIIGGVIRLQTNTISWYTSARKLLIASSDTGHYHSTGYLAIREVYGYK